MSTKSKEVLDAAKKKERKEEDKRDKNKVKHYKGPPVNTMQKEVVTK